MSDQISPSRKVLIVAQRPSDFVEMKRCALSLEKRGWKIQFVYFCATEDSDSEVIEYLKQKAEDGTFSSVEIRSYASSKNKKFSGVPNEPFYKNESIYNFYKCFWNANILKPLKFKMKHKIYNDRNSIFYKINIILKSSCVIIYYFSEKKILKEIVNRLSPDIIILPEDVVGYCTPIIIKVGHDLNIPSLILPYTIANEQEAFRSLAGNTNYHLKTWGNGIVGKCFPRWVMHDKGLSLVRMPAPYILGQILTKTSPPKPWMMNSGFSNVIAVENNAMHDYYVSAGIPETKVEVVGSISDDHLAKFKLNKQQELISLKEELSIEGTKPLLLIGGCPDQSGSCPAGFAYGSFDDFVAHLARAIEPLKKYYDVIVRPHPNNMRMGELFSKYDVQSTEIDTARLVALSDAYIAFASATIRWAISCEVPVLNYDVFHYDYNDFKGIGGVLNVNSRDGLKHALESFDPNCDKFGDLTKEIKNSSGRWGILDGCSTDRIVALIDKVCSYEKVLRTSE